MVGVFSCFGLFVVKLFFIGVILRVFFRILGWILLEFNLFYKGLCGFLVVGEIG